MRVLVVYESMFGNTQAVALAVADGIRSAAGPAAVEFVEVGAAPTALPPEVALLVVGGPTHGHGMTNRNTRADAARRAGERLISKGDGIREWLDALAPTSNPTVAAAFDTRIRGPELLWGSAAKGAARRLASLGFRLATPPQSFLVEGPTGPVFDRLAAGELEKARSWGARLGASVTVEPAAPATR